MRSGTSQKTGNEWQRLPFVFEYFEHDTDRWADSVVLETFDTKVIEALKEGMEVICGFGHKAKEITKQDGTKTMMNELRLYKIESIRKANQAPRQANGQQMAQYPPQVDTYGNPINPINPEDDDLPF